LTVCVSIEKTEIEERRVGAALEVDLDIVPTGSDGDGELIGEVIGQLSEYTDLFVGAQDVVTENNV
jgi:hypothetical protein